jgi:hypothetical protein
VVGNSHSKDFFNLLASSNSFTEAFELARFGEDIACLVEAENDFFSSLNYRAAHTVVIASFFRNRGCDGVSNTHPTDYAALPEVLSRIADDGKQAIVIGPPLLFGERSEVVGAGRATIADRYAKRHQVTAIESEEQLADLAEQVNIAYFRHRRELVAQRERLRAIAEEAGAAFVPRDSYLCSLAEGQCFGVSERFEKHFYDLHHLTIAGAAFFSEKVTNELANALSTRRSIDRGNQWISD